MGNLTFDQFLKGERPPEPSHKLKPDIPVTNDMRLWRVAGHAAHETIITAEPDQRLFGFQEIAGHLGVSPSTARRYHKIYGLPVALITNRWKHGPEYMTTRPAIRCWLYGFHLLTTG